MREQERILGIDSIHGAPWGTHVCQFYETQEDLFDILIPYFKAGLENNELCMWITSEPVWAHDAKAALKKEVRNLDDYIKKGQIEIMDYHQWYTKSGKFDADEVLQGWIEKHSQALKRGFDGLRLSGNTFWLKEKDWNNFANYEVSIDNIISNYRMIAICSYSLKKCGASELLDVVMNHKFALIRRGDKWEVFESAGRKRAETEIQSLAKFPDENPYPVLRIAKDCTILYANKASQPLLSTWEARVDRPLPVQWRKIVFDVLASGTPEFAETESEDRILSLVFAPIRDEEYINIYGFDITKRKVVEKKLEKYAQDLARSNADLAQFAHVVSHDLQEPLRMVTEYLKLLSSRYKGKLDSTADDFIFYAVNGAERMSTLIRELLKYSCIGEGGKDFEPTDCKALLDQIVSDLMITIKNSGMKVTYDPLPTVMANKVQLRQLLQNLIDNANKFRRDEFPHVHISAKPNGDEYIFSVQDNGIGIDMKQTDSIFQVFRRLHLREEYPGNGVGLAICKKIVERHSGRIWVESKPGRGSTFFFTIPS